LVLLAQASMTRVAEAMPQAAGAAPILSSAPFAMQRLLRTLEAN
jgi:hypothetical protein